MVSKLKLVRGRVYEPYNSKEVKKELREETKAEEEATAREEQEAPVPLFTHVNNNLHSIVSNVEVYINSQQIYNSNGLYEHNSYFSNNLKGANCEYKGVLHCEGYENEEFFDEIKEAPLSEPFFTRRMKMLSRPDGFMLYGKLGVDFLSIYEFQYPKMKIRLRLMRARPNFYMISDNPNVRLGIVDCSLYTPRAALKDDYHRIEWTCWLILLWGSIIWKLLQRLSSFLLDKTSSFNKNIFNNARRIAIAINKNSAFTGSYTEKPFWYQHFHLRQIRILRGGQPIVDFDAANKCRLYVTTMKALNFHDHIPLIPNDNFKDHYVIAFDLTSMQDATENCYYTELVREPLRLALNFTFPLEHVTELIVLGERMSSVAVDKLVLLEKNI